MPKHETTTLGAPCWIDVLTTDPEKTQSFYGALFGWTVDDPGPDYGGYKNFVKDGAKVAGFMRSDTPGAPEMWSTYLTTDDAQATVDAAAAHGGQVIVPPAEVLELGTMAVVSDPGGASIGIWQPGLHRGFDVIAEPGAPAWFELHTQAYDASVQFYRDVFKWDARTMSDEPEFRYTTLGEGEDQAAGIMDEALMPEGGPSHWAVYFNVESADAAVTTIERLGGTIIQPAMDSPYGRLVEAADLTGARFRLQQPT